MNTATSRGLTIDTPTFLDRMPPPKFWPNPGWLHITNPGWFHGSYRVDLDVEKNTATIREVTT